MIGLINMCVCMYTCMYTTISRKVVGKICTRQSRKVVWDMFNTLFLTTVAVEPTFVAFRNHSQTYFHGISCHSFKFLWKTVNSRPPTIPFGFVAFTLSDNLSRNSCICLPSKVWVDGIWPTVVFVEPIFFTLAALSSLMIRNEITANHASLRQTP